MISRYGLLIGSIALYTLPILLLSSQYSVPALLTYAIFASAITVVDFSDYEIPDILTAMLAAGALPFIYNAPDLTTRLIVGALLTATVWFLGGILFRRFGTEFIGIGDAKLFGAVALWVAPMAMPDVVFLASIGGIVLGILSSQARHSGIPFGPFLAYAGYIMLFLDPILIAL